MGRCSKRFLQGEKLASGRGLYKTAAGRSAQDRPAELFEGANKRDAWAVRSARNQDTDLVVYEGVRHDA
ncbi:hypothetical protein GCM10010236_37530 [Streptomyces eurythermus]|nr:hypothetical protein GCM10010236_37530 [Streptomyces eurythermus]